MTYEEEAHQLREALVNLVEQVDEDCPQEYRTRHLIEAIEDARYLLRKTKC